MRKIVTVLPIDNFAGKHFVDWAEVINKQTKVKSKEFTSLREAEKFHGDLSWDEGRYLLK